MYLAQRSLNCLHYCWFVSRSSSGLCVGVLCLRLISALSGRMAFCNLCLLLLCSMMWTWRELWGLLVLLKSLLGEQLLGERLLGNHLGVLCSTV